MFSCLLAAILGRWSVRFCTRERHPSPADALPEFTNLWSFKEQIMLHVNMPLHSAFFPNSLILAQCATVHPRLPLDGLTIHVTRFTLAVVLIRWEVGTEFHALCTRLKLPTSAYRSFRSCNFQAKSGTRYSSNRTAKLRPPRFRAWPLAF